MNISQIKTKQDMAKHWLYINKNYERLYKKRAFDTKEYRYFEDHYIAMNVAMDNIVRQASGDYPEKLTQAEIDRFNAGFKRLDFVQSHRKRLKRLSDEYFSVMVKTEFVVRRVKSNKMTAEIKLKNDPFKIKEGDPLGT